jgi:hypothetical protein
MGTPNRTSEVASSPFYPGSPVSAEHFAGRSRELELVDHAVQIVANGGSRALFLTGARGIGKTSLARYVRIYAKKHYGLAAAHAMVTQTANVADACAVVLGGLVSDLPQASMQDRIVKVLKKYVKNIEVFGLRVELNPTKSEDLGLPGNLLAALQDAYSALKSEADSYHGLMIIMDDIDRLARRGDVASFLKGFVDGVAIADVKLPLLLVVTGYRDSMRLLGEQHPSVPRIFQTVELDVLSPIDTRKLFIDAFNSVSIKTTSEAVSAMSRMSGGHPGLAQEVGEAAFWEFRGGEASILGTDTVEASFNRAADQVSQKYLRPHLRDVADEPVLLPFIRAMVATPGDSGIPVARLARLTGLEKERVARLASRLTEIGVWSTKRGSDQPDAYFFTAPLYNRALALELQWLQEKAGQTALTDFDTPGPKAGSKGSRNPTELKP